MSRKNIFTQTILVFLAILICPAIVTASGKTVREYATVSIKPMEKTVKVGEYIGFFLEIDSSVSVKGGGFKVFVSNDSIIPARENLPFFIDSKGLRDLDYICPSKTDTEIFCPKTEDGAHYFSFANFQNGINLEGGRRVGIIFFHAKKAGEVTVSVEQSTDFPLVRYPSGFPVSTVDYSLAKATIRVEKSTAAARRAAARQL